MNKNDIVKKVPDAINEVFGVVPFVRSTQVVCRYGVGDPDFNVFLRLDNCDVTMMVSVKVSGEPRFAREAVNELLRFRSKRLDAYPVFVAPYVSPSAGQILKEARMGYLDLAGNCYLAFGSVFISREGRKNPYGSSRKLKSLCKPISSRILRVVLADPSRVWKSQPLSVEADASIGQVANVKQVLKDREWIKESPDGFHLSSPKETLVEWAENYDFRKNTIKSFYAIEGVSGAEKRVAEACHTLGIEYAITSFAGAARLVPNVRYKRSEIYVAERIEAVAEEAGLKQVDSGANVRLLEPYDPGVFYKSSEISGLRVSCPVQVYLDVLAQKGRGEEAAESIMHEIISKSW